MIKRIVKAVKECIKGKPLKVRSARWDDVRDEFVKKYPWCAACGSRSNLQVHHIIPFHVDSTLELDNNNLITLCEQKPSNCHLKIGHLGNWKKFNPWVRQDAAKMLMEKTKNLSEQ